MLLEFLSSIATVYIVITSFIVGLLALYGGSRMVFALLRKPRENQASLFVIASSVIITITGIFLVIVGFILVRSF